MTAALTRRPALEVPLAIPTRPAAPPRPAGPVPLARRRLAALALAAVLAVLAGAGIRAGVTYLGDVGTSAGGSTAPAPTAVVAQPGDSYFDLARQVHDGGDLRSTVDALRAANGGRELRAGDRILLAG